MGTDGIPRGLLGSGDCLGTLRLRLRASERELSTLRGLLGGVRFPGPGPLSVTSGKLQNFSEPQLRGLSPASQDFGGGFDEILLAKCMFW